LQIATNSQFVLSYDLFQNPTDTGTLIPFSTLKIGNMTNLMMNLYVIRTYKFIIKFVIFPILSVKNVTFKLSSFIFNKHAIRNKWRFIKII
ncbi:hypothetical protein AAGX60_13935, partial [Staphylococcus aureus]